MALQSSGAISIQQINAEFNAGTNLNVYRGKFWANPGGSTGLLPGTVAPFSISMNDFYGKGYAINIASNQSNLNLRTYLVNAGWNQTQPVIAYISSGVYISSSSTATPAMTISGSFPGGLWVINNGFVVGMGGAGGTGARRNVSGDDATAGGAGGLALLTTSAVSIRNLGTIGGGGGGGGGGGEAYAQGDYGSFVQAGGAGGSGGRTGTTNSAAGIGGINGKIGTSSAGGTATSGQSQVDNSWGISAYGGAGGNGGTWGGSGGAGASGVFTASLGGGRTLGKAGGGAGAAVSGNSNITWLATGIRLGAIN